MEEGNNKMAIKKLIPERRKHGCDMCHKDTSTEVFLGYRKNVLWICGDCYKKVTNNIKKEHNQDVWTYKKFDNHKLNGRHD